MVKQFIPYEQALELKELGFDEECFGVYDKMGYIQNEKEMDALMLEKIKAPLWQQAFDWFRDEKNLLNHLTTHLNTWGEDNSLETYYGYRIMIDKDGWKCEVWEELSSFETYEEARLQCLKKLIELCK